MASFGDGSGSPTYTAVPTSATRQAQAVTMQIGQSMNIRMQHVVSRNFIGEIMRVVTVDAGKVYFELVAQPQHYLRILNTGRVEFSRILDDQSIFVSNSAGNGAQYFMCTAFLGMTNQAGEMNWYLSMTPGGVLYGNGFFNPWSKWMLISVGGNAPQAQPPVAQPAHHESRGHRVHSSISQGQLPCNQDSLTPDDWMAWLSSAAGKQFLASQGRGMLQTLYNEGKIKRILHRPDWPRLANRWVDYHKFEMREYNEVKAEEAVNNVALKAFFDRGFVTLPKMATPELIHRALKVAEFWTVHRNGQTSRNMFGGVSLSGGISQDIDIMALFYQTNLIHAMQRIIGRGDVACPLTAEVMAISPDLFFDFDKRNENPEYKAKSWVVEGFTPTGDHSPYTTFVAVALSDFTSPGQGNLCVHSESHVILQEEVKRQIADRSTLFSEVGFHPSKPNLDEPIEIQMRPGDVLIATQKMALQRTLNFSDQIKYLVVFRVSHVDHNVMKDPALDGIWVEYNGLNLIESLPPVQDINLLEIEDKSATASQTTPSAPKISVQRYDANAPIWNDTKQNQGGHMDRDSMYGGL